MPEFVPDEKETIAAKRSARLARKLFESKTKRRISPAWWNAEHTEFLFLMLIVFLNIFVIYDIFGTPAPDIPYSGPVVPIFAKILTVTGIGMGFAYQIVNIVFFLLFPLTLYFFVRKITDRKLPAFLTVLISSLPFFPFAEVRAHAAFYGGDGPHIVSLTFIPLALTGVILFIRRGGLRSFFVASVTGSFIALISAFGFMNFALFSALICFSEMLLGNGRIKILRFVAILIASAALSSFWYNPGLLNWMILGPFGEDVREMVKRLIPISLFTIPLLATFGYILFDRKPTLQPIFLASFFTISFAIIALSGGGVFPGNPSRYVAEFGLSLAFLISVVIVKLADYVRIVSHNRGLGNKSGRRVNAVLVFLIVILVLGTVWGRDNIFVNKNTVLGIWTDVERGEIWAKRDSFGTVSNVFGYLITSSSVLGFGYLGKITNDGKKTKNEIKGKSS